MDEHDDLSNDPFMKEIARLQSQKSLKGTEYYLITLLGNEDGTIERTVYSEWVGFTETKPLREIREASIIDYPEIMRETYHRINEPSSIVNDEKDMYVFLLTGGHGFIEKSLAEKFFPKLIKPKTVNYSFSKGFIHTDSLPPHKTNHAPTKKVRMNVIKRDNLRCKICGRSPNDYVDLELHVHHIIPWGGRYSGITEEDNLITLCNTCHDGLEPHYEPRLFELLGINHLRDVIHQDRYLKGLKLYMDIVREHHSKIG